MNVLYVVNNAFVYGNGLSASARRCVEHLRERGLNVRFLTKKDEDMGEIPVFALPPWKVPIFEDLVESQGYEFAESNEEVIEEALNWADIVHIEEPFLLQMHTIKMAEKLGKVLVGTYHLHPENLYSSIHLRKEKLINTSTMILWRESVFNHLKIIQCPTENVKNRLEQFNFKSELRVISNGMVPKIVSGEHIDNTDGKYLIVSTGRFSIEKDQMCLLKALKYSKHAKDIRLVLAGQGPRKENLMKYAKKIYDEGIISCPVEFSFFSMEELENLYLHTDLYIHCATVEVEGLACMEAIQVGIVPIIAKGDLTSTSQFALNDLSTYEAGNAKELAKRIDYWLDNDELRKEEAKKYIGMGEKYDIEKSIDKLIEMYEDALK